MLGKDLKSFRVSTYEQISVLHYFLYTLYYEIFSKHLCDLELLSKKAFFTLKTRKLHYLFVSLRPSIHLFFTLYYCTSLCNLICASFVHSCKSLYVFPDWTIVQESLGPRALSSTCSYIYLTRTATYCRNQGEINRPVFLFFLKKSSKSLIFAIMSL